MLTKHTYSLPILLIALTVPVLAAAPAEAAGERQRIGLAPAVPAPATLSGPAEHLQRSIAVVTERIRAARKARRERRRREREEAFAALPGGVSRSTLEAIAACESGGDPAIVSADGSYRGKYQFSVSTWATVGGSGDPAAAPEAEQDYRAALLYSRAGSSPWPVCGL